MSSRDIPEESGHEASAGVPPHPGAPQAAPSSSTELSLDEPSKAVEEAMEETSVQPSTTIAQDDQVKESAFEMDEPGPAPLRALAQQYLSARDDKDQPKGADEEKQDLSREGAVPGGESGKLHGPYRLKQEELSSDNSSSSRSNSDSPASSSLAGDATTESGSLPEISARWRLAESVEGMRLFATGVDPLKMLDQSTDIWQKRQELAMRVDTFEPEPDVDSSDSLYGEKVKKDDSPHFTPIQPPPATSSRLTADVMPEKMAAPSFRSSEYPPEYFGIMPLREQPSPNPFFFKSKPEPEAAVEAGAERTPDAQEQEVREAVSSKRRSTESPEREFKVRRSSTSPRGAKTEATPPKRKRSFCETKEDEKDPSSAKLRRMAVSPNPGATPEDPEEALAEKAQEEKGSSEDKPKSPPTNIQL